MLPISGVPRKITESSSSEISTAIPPKQPSRSDDRYQTRTTTRARILVRGS